MSQRPAAGPLLLVGVLGACSGPRSCCRPSPAGALSGEGPGRQQPGPGGGVVGILGAILGASLLLPPGPRGAGGDRPRRPRPDQGGAGRGAPLAPHRDARHRRPRDRDRPPLQRLLHPGSPAGRQRCHVRGRLRLHQLRRPPSPSATRCSVDGQVQEFRPGCTPSCAQQQRLQQPDHHRDRHRRRRRQRARRQLGNPTPTPDRPRRRRAVPPDPGHRRRRPGRCRDRRPLRPRQRRDRLLREPGGDARAGQRRRRRPGPGAARGEIPVLGDDGDGAGQRTTRGGVVVRAGDFNPERIFLDDLFTTTPKWTSATASRGAIIGVMDYSFGNFKLQVTPPCRRLQPAALPRESGASRRRRTSWPWPPSTWRTSTRPTRRPSSPRLAALIVEQPAGARTSWRWKRCRTTTARRTTPWSTPAAPTPLIQAIKARRRPGLRVPPDRPGDDQDGGRAGRQHPGGASSSAPTAGLRFVDRPGGRPATTATIAVLPARTGHSLRTARGGSTPPTPPGATAASPWRGSSRYNGQTLFVIANHFNSKGGDEPLFGRFQPPVLNPRPSAGQQAQVVRGLRRRTPGRSTRRRGWSSSATSTTSSSPPRWASSRARPALTALMETLPPGSATPTSSTATPRPSTTPWSVPRLLAQRRRLRRRARQRRVRGAGERPRPPGDPLPPLRNAHLPWRRLLRARGHALAHPHGGHGDGDAHRDRHRHRHANCHRCPHREPHRHGLRDRRPSATATAAPTATVSPARSPPPPSSPGASASWARGSSMPGTGRPASPSRCAGAPAGPSPGPSSTAPRSLARPCAATRSPASRSPAMRPPSPGPAPT